MTDAVTSHAGSISLSRYRPALYILTGIAAAYAAVYIHGTYIAPPVPSSSQAPLRRRNAVRRHHHRRNTDTHLTDHDVPEAVLDTPSYRAISHLTQLERENGVYGTFRIETEDGRRVESGLLPSLLATRDQLMADVGVPPGHAERMREMMESTFLESFFALDFPPSHIIEEGSAEREFLVEELHRRGISRAGIATALERFNADENYGSQLRQQRQNGQRITLTGVDDGVDIPLQATFDGAETTVDDRSVFSWRDGNNTDSSNLREGQNLLNLLYHIAEDQARRDGYIHRGVTCNSCGAMPIQGIRYRCANCIDYDLCETCEAMQVHIKTHLFYKVRIPAPFLGNPRQSQPVWYPGKPMMLPRNLPRPLAKRLMRETNFENTELDALWDQFRCLANVEWSSDSNELGMAIDRKTFDRCFVPNTSIRPPPPSLIYDRMFAFYDTNGDNLIGFEEFLKGLASFNNKSADERMRRIFRGYDIDGDGYVERRDFLRMFRAYYTLSRELTRDMVAGLEDDFLEGGARDVILGSQPISSAFPGSIPTGEASRIGDGKRTNLQGDLEIIDNEGVLSPDGTDQGDRNTVVGDAAVRHEFGRVRPIFPSTVRLPPMEETRPTSPDPLSSRAGATSLDGEDYETRDDDNDDGSDDDSVNSGIRGDQWPPAEHVIDEDIVNALGAYVPLHEVTDRVDRARIGTAVYHRMRDEDQRRIEEVRRHGIEERWQRRRFYTDEEDGAIAPEGYEETSDFYDFSDEDVTGEDSVSESRLPSPRSRSSSKVRFEDDVTDDCDVRSNPSTSSRSIPVGERWGGFEVPEVEKDAGKEVLYQVIQQGLNELLDVLFKWKEDLLMEAYRTRAERKCWAREIELIEQLESSKRPDGASNSFRIPFSLPTAQAGVDNFGNKTLDELLRAAGYSISPTIDVLYPTDSILTPPAAARAAHNVDDDLRPTCSRAPEDDEDSIPDPTLPQNRPNGDDVDSFNSHPRARGDSPQNAGSRQQRALDPHQPRLSFRDEPIYIPNGSNDYDDRYPDEVEVALSSSRSRVRSLGHPEPSPLRLSLEATDLTSFFPVPEATDPSSPEAEETAPKLPLVLQEEAIEEADVDATNDDENEDEKEADHDPLLSSPNIQTQPNQILLTQAPSSTSSSNNENDGDDDQESSHRQRTLSRHQRLRPHHLRLIDSSATSSTSDSSSRPNVAKSRTKAPSPPTNIPSTNQPSSSSSMNHRVQAPSPRTLSRWSLLNKVEKEARERCRPPSPPTTTTTNNHKGSGGMITAKLSFEEFAHLMNVDRGRKLGFVGTWIEMASF